MKKINTVGVVGAGTMGSAIAQKFAQQGFKVILADREMKYVEKGINGIKDILNQGVERGLFSAKQVESIVSNISGTHQLERLKACDLIVEAIFENFDAKCDLFKTLDSIVDQDIIIATNTSSFSVTELSKSISNPARFIGLHYFYHAAKNRLVEIIPGKETSAETYKAMQVFSVLAGKDAITTADTYGFAVNRFFVPWLNEAVRLYEEKTVTIPQVEKVCMKLFGIGMGPFALMNATGVPIAYHAQKTLEVFGNLYHTCPLLQKQAESGNPWNLGDIENAAVSSELEKLITERMAGVVFFVCSQILAENVCSASDLNRGARIGLRWRLGPIDLMLKFGAEDVNRLVKKIAGLYKMELPGGIQVQNWHMDYVSLEKVGAIATITMSRPEDMNALNETVMAQLDQKFSDADADPAVSTIFITGTGKAFVAGADIRFFVKNMKAGKLKDIELFSKFGQQVYDRIDHSAKNVVAVLNGLALGGGLELALCADTVLALPQAVMAFPETGIGIYPGLGGTQRTAQKIGKGLTKYLIYTGQFINCTIALEMGLIDAIIDPADLFDVLHGYKAIPDKRKSYLSDHFNALSSFFDQYSVNEILSGISENDFLPVEEAQKLSKKLGQKAPLALQTAEKLINEASGCESELKELTRIFATEDALTGLSSIGKRVEFIGR
jgi:enoyl-CoA hydratase/3-hydroxyacyl-CoA dehydrogenase